MWGDAVRSDPTLSGGFLAYHGLCSLLPAMPRTRAIVLTVTAAVVSASGMAPRDALAQEVVGEVLQQSGEGIGDATVGVLDADGELVALARSESSGRFRVRAPSPGDYTRSE